MILLLLACGAPGPDGEPEREIVPAEPLVDTGLVAPPTPEDPAAADPEPDPPTSPPEPPEPECTLGPHTERFVVELTHAGRQRRAHVDLPPGYDGTTPLPMVLNFHGLAMNGNLQRSYTGMADAANDRGWIAVHPDGRNSSWAFTPGSQDTGFIEALLDALEAEVCVDASRVYATGLSNGGYFSYVLGCELPERFAAIAPVAGLDATLGCNPGMEVPLLHIHGTGDDIVPYTGALFQPSAPESVRRWSNRANDCAMAPDVVVDGLVTCETRSCAPTAEATLCTIDGGDHAWPGAIPIPLLSSASTAMDANPVILDFFEAYSRP